MQSLVALILFRHVNTILLFIHVPLFASRIELPHKQSFVAFLLFVHSYNILLFAHAELPFACKIVLPHQQSFEEIITYS